MLNMTLHPQPQKIAWEEEAFSMPQSPQFQITYEGRIPERDVLNRLNLWYAASGYTPAAAGNILLKVSLKKEQALLFDEQFHAYSDEGYVVQLTVEHDMPVIHIFAAALRGLRYALSTLQQLLQQKIERCVTITDRPRFGIRAIIEGYYGPPWKDELRMSMLELMAEHKMNAYFYAPKDDPYHREQWRELYDDAGSSMLKQTFEKTVELDLDFWYNIGPGLSMKYSSADDFAALARKLEQIYDFGVRYFGLLFDDIPMELQHPEDREAFDDLPQAHAHIANTLFRYLREKDPAIRMVCCPTQYWGKGTEYYISRLGAELDCRIELFWTGPEICSRELTLEDACRFMRRTNRPVLYWDNYPVNDVEMTEELHIGPYRERDPHLFRAGCGIVANGMEYAESSKIPYLTIADYLWNPEQYAPEESWNYALQRVVGNENWEAFRIFADNNRFSCLYPSDSPELRKTLERFEFLSKQKQQEKALELLHKQISRLNLAVELFQQGMQNTVLQAEIQKWADKFIKGVALLQETAAYAAAPDAETRKALEARYHKFQQDRTYLFSDVLWSFVKGVMESL
ncbi:MAG: hypothetical protein GY801_09770 [bacterium]|nr:hypothetical protein [bacterium]